MNGLILRPMTDADRNLVLSSWLESYSNSLVGIDRGAFFRLYKPLVAAMVDRGGVIVAGLPDIADSVLGWMASHNEVLHYVFVKPRWRKLGVARALLEGTETLPITYSHEPPKWAHLPGGWHFDPLARFGEP